MNKIRSYDLDNLKVFLTVMVIFHHAGQAYGNGGDWPYHPSNPAEYMPEIWRFFSTNAPVPNAPWLPSMKRASTI